MNNQKKTVPAAKPVAAPKPLKKLIPRTAPKLAVPAASSPAEALPGAAPAAVTPPLAAPAAVPGSAAATAKARPARKPTKEDEIVAKHQKVLAEALAMAQAIDYTQPKVMRPPVTKGKKAAKPGKPAKARKPKLVRDSYAMPEAEYAKIGELKKRLAAVGAEVKKSELLRGGLAVLAALSDAELAAVMARVERIKTGRPAR